MLTKAILVVLLVTGSQWWPSYLITRTWLYLIRSGFFTGVIMEGPALGVQAAAYIQLTYLGWITARGSIPGNLMVAGICGTALTVLSDANPKLVISFAVMSSLLGILINRAYMTLNSIWVCHADKYLKEGSPKGVRLMNYVSSGILSLVLCGILVMLMILHGAQWAQGTLVTIPQWFVDALNLASAIMSALGIAVLLNYLGKKRLIAFFFFGLFVTVYLKLDTMSLFIFSTVTAAVMYFFNRDRGEGGT